MTNILALETATSSCSVALQVGETLTSRSEVGSNIHSQVLLGMVEDVLKQAQIAVDQLDAIAVGQGPGSFTGLRIGVGVGQGLAYGIACPMIGVSSLDALALAAPDDGHVLAGIDARMGEIYWGEYQKEGNSIRQIGALRVTSPEAIADHFLSDRTQADIAASEKNSKVHLVGNAWTEYWDRVAPQFKQSLIRTDSLIYPSASMLLSLASRKYQIKDWVAAIDFEPIYVRNDVAKKAVKR